MMTSSLSPISPTSVVRSSSAQGLSRLLTRVRGAADLGQAFSRRDLLVAVDRVFQVAEQHVALLSELGNLGGHLRVARVEEVNHPRRAEGDLARRSRGADRLDLEEVFGATHGGLLGFKLRRA
jgi:hypothetical protein